MVLSQTYIRINGRTAHTVTALDSNTIALGHTGWEPGYVDCGTHMTVDEAEELVGLLTDAIQTVREHRPIAPSNVHPVMAEAIRPFLESA